MYSITLFNNQYDNATDKRIDFETYSQLENFLLAASRHPAKKGGPGSSPLISPAVYYPGTKRANDNVVEWTSWCAIDVDELQFDSDSYFSTDSDVRAILEPLVGKYRYTCYSTASSKHNRPKFRLVFPLSCPVSCDQIKHFWFAINTEIAGMGDKQTKDFSRMFFVPGQYPEAFNFFFTNAGEVIDPDELMARWEYKEQSGSTFYERLPEEMQHALLQYRKDQMENNTVTWSSYRDCPYFSKKLAAEYIKIQHTGWYHKMYQIMVATAFSAIRDKYPITANEIADLCSEFDRATGSWYGKRPLKKEADRAIEFAYRNSSI